jgi:hypothetical protein
MSKAALEVMQDPVARQKSKALFYAINAAGGWKYIKGAALAGLRCEGQQTPSGNWVWYRVLELLMMLLFDCCSPISTSKRSYTTQASCEILGRLKLKRGGLFRTRFRERN